MGLWRVLSDLEEEGYRTTFGIFSAEEVGAPHQRKRVFILAYTPRGRFEQCESKCEKKNILSEGSEKQLGDTKLTGLEGFGDKARKRSQGREKEERSVTSTDSGAELAHTRWPARPGEEQYEWEEPRVTEAQSELGGAVDGLTHRVDRLRLLGNGVVPQTAELAWRTLWRKMNEDNH